MVNTSQTEPSNRLDRAASPDRLDRLATLVKIYVVVVLATIAGLAVLSSFGSGQATSAAWAHAVIVGVFAVVLPLRLIAARHGSRRAVVAVGAIATVLVVVNLTEALIPGLLPVWMRLEMVGIAMLMAAIAGLAWRRP